MWFNSYYGLFLMVLIEIDFVVSICEFYDSVKVLLLYFI